ncbi:uncharacterized protein LOC135498104 [Lineus longissimus]|uniref:uncharacterized protein LOC135498104 n=1 Tax=Lineus longissimus TaxID=88925 RepID=UPI002B4E0F8F
MNSATVDPTGEEISLDVIPTGDDHAVQTFMTDHLQRQLLMKQFNLSIRRAGMFLYIGTLAMAQRSEELIKVQNALLENLKLNDTSAVMLQSFQSGAVNIVEKLKVAYLYLMDGFPEFAKTDVEAIGKDISTMRAQADKTKKSTAECAKDVEAIKKLVEGKIKKVQEKMKEIEEIKRGRENPAVPSYQSGARPKEERDKWYTCVWCNREYDCHGCFECWYFFCACFFPYRDSNTDQDAPGPTESKHVEVDPDEEEEELHKLVGDLELLKLTLEVLSKASLTLRECDGFLDQLLGVVDKWYKENKEVVTPSMAENIRRTEGMSEEEMRKYWQSIMFKQEVQRFYTRWVALKMYCESTRKNLKDIRAETEAWYVDNPRPRDAVKKAWEIARKVDDKELNKLIKKKDERIEKQHDPAAASALVNTN